MSVPDSVPEISPESVRTLPQAVLVGSVGPLCPICERVELRGRQTVCGPACRRERSRQRQAEAVQAELGELRHGLDLLRTRLDGLAERVGRTRSRRRER